VLRIAVQADGTAPRPEIVGSAGVPPLDEEALRAVAAALPLPPPPRELLGGASSAPFVLGLRVVRNEAPSAGDEQQEPFAVIAARIDDGARGTIDPLDVQRTVESESTRRDVSNCLSRQRDVGAEESVGEVTLEFVITESGSVNHPIVAKTRNLSRSLEGCLVSAISLWTFRKPTGGAAKVMFPFRFGGGAAVGATPDSGMKRQSAGGSR
jgi:TonB family protein